MFKKVTSRVSFPQMEEEVLRFWKEADIFRKSGEQGHKGRFMLYEGPPTANGSPGIHHVLARVFKDIICRYKTMKGYRPLRKGGWDTHGLPVELEIERELGLKTKRDIEEYGIERFNQKCRESVFRYVKEWENLTDRIAFWVDMDHPYVTLDNSYIETGWWILKQLWDKGLIYKGVKATPHCPRCVTSLSSHEVAQGYQENTPDPSVYVKFQILWDSPHAQALRDKLPSEAIDNTYLLAWTTTPWTLPGNTALAINPEAQYVIIDVATESGAQRLILAEALVQSVVRTSHTPPLLKFPGSQLLGIPYKPLYDPLKAELPDFSVGRVNADGSVVTRAQKPPIHTPELYEYYFTNSWKVIPGDFVSMEDGTGIVHIAPAFGEEDLNAGRRHGLAFVQQVDLRGLITGAYPFAGKFVKDADEDIIADLSQRGLLYHRDVYRHTYPFCWRCKTPLLYYAKESWYIRTTALKDRLISGNQEINWYPEHIKEGRFGEWLQNGVDWAISRERYWGTPIPLWQCQNPDCGHYHFIGTVAELKAMASAQHKDRIDGLDLHRPYVDEITLDCPQCSGPMARIPEVMDAWFDSGAMPLAQWNVTSQDQLQALRDDHRFPADYICEAVDQTRGWFYSLLAISILVADEPSYRNVICLGHILDDKGRKMSKSQGNVVVPWDILNAQGADAIRWYLFTATQPGDSRRFSQGLVNEVVRRFMLTLWNVYSFFVTYAEIDAYDPTKTPAPEKPTSELDRWVLSELSSLTTQVDASLESYDPTTGGRRIQEFVDLLSNWYVRRSRRRFWRSENDDDKLSAYHTLYTCLVTLAKLMAPYTPFLAEEMYRNLVHSVDPKAPESVHLAPFPTPDPSLVDQPLMEATRLAMHLSSLGRDARSRAGVKVRKPLQEAIVFLRDSSEEAYIDLIYDQVIDELNVKSLRVGTSEEELYNFYKKLQASTNTRVGLEGYHVMVYDGGYMVALDTRVTPELAREGLARELVHRIQNMRKAAGFEVTDRILSYYRGPQEVRDVIASWGNYIRRETLSQELNEGDADDGAHVETQKVEGMELVLGVKRVT